MIRVLIKYLRQIVLFVLSGAVLTLCPLAWAQSGAGGYANTAGTQSSLNVTAYALRSAYNLQAMAMHENLLADADLEGGQDFSVGVLGRDVSLTGQPTAQSSNLVVVVGKRISPNWRVGLYVDQTIGTEGMDVAHVSQSANDLGGYGVWTPTDNPRDVQVRMSVGWSGKTMSVQRPAGAGAEGGWGTTQLETVGYQVQGSWRLAMGKRSSLRPYAGLRYVRVSDKRYTETADVSTPLTLGPLVQESVAVLAGVQANMPLTQRVSLLVHLGIEQDLAHQGGDYSETSQKVAGLLPVALNTIYNPTRGMLELAIQKEVTPLARVHVGVKFAEQAHASQVAVSMLLGCVTGF